MGTQLFYDVFTSVPGTFVHYCLVSNSKNIWYSAANYGKHGVFIGADHDDEINFFINYTCDVIIAS